MNGANDPRMEKRRFNRRVAAFAAGSLALHVVLLLLIQSAGRGEAPPAPEQVPVQLVELEPPPQPDPGPETIVPQEIPSPPETPEIPQQPEPEAPTPPQPEIPDEPAPQPDIPDEPAETPDIPEPTPSPAEPDGAQMIAPGDRADEGAAGIPGLTYDGGRDSDLAWFGHAVECMQLELRHEEYCADIGPIYVAENIERLAPEVEAMWREVMARRRARGQPIDPMGECADDPAGGPPGSCMAPTEVLRQRGQGVRDAIP
jgi:hypothetical protein